LYRHHISEKAEDKYPSILNWKKESSQNMLGLMHHTKWLEIPASLNSKLGQNIWLNIVDVHVCKKNNNKPHLIRLLGTSHNNNQAASHKSCRTEYISLNRN
jgi:hypothetical protein